MCINVFTPSREVIRIAHFVAFSTHFLIKEPPFLRTAEFLAKKYMKKEFFYVL